MDENKLLNAVLDIQSSMATQSDVAHINKRFDGIADVLDQHTTILQRVDQERVFTSEWIRRIESEVEDRKRRVNIA